MVSNPKPTTDELLANALANGLSVAGAARTAGVSPSTAYRRLRDPAFTARVDELRDGMLLSVRGLFTSRMVVACEALYQLLGHLSPAARIKAARTLVELALKLNDWEGRTSPPGQDAPGDPSEIPEPAAEGIPDMASEASAAASSGAGVAPERIELHQDLTAEGRSPGAPVISPSTDVQETFARGAGQIDPVPAVVATGTGGENTPVEMLSKPVTAGHATGTGAENACVKMLSKPVTGGHATGTGGENASVEMLSKPVTAGHGFGGEPNRQKRGGRPPLRSAVQNGPGSAGGPFADGVDQLSAALSGLVEQLGSA